MPITYYTQEEYKSAIAERDKKAMALAQDLCNATGYECIRGPNDSDFGGKGYYCYDCPALNNCPSEDKRFSK